jgi:hypothetical protein
MKPTRCKRCEVEIGNTSVERLLGVCAKCLARAAQDAAKRIKYGGRA